VHLAAPELAGDSDVAEDLDGYRDDVEQAEIHASHCDVIQVRLDEQDALIIVVVVVVVVVVIRVVLVVVMVIAAQFQLKVVVLVIIVVQFQFDVVVLVVILVQFQLEVFAFSGRQKLDEDARRVDDRRQPDNQQVDGGPAHATTMKL